MRVAKPVYAPLAYRGPTNLRHYYEETTIPSNLTVLGAQRHTITKLADLRNGSFINRKVGNNFISKRLSIH